MANFDDQNFEKRLLGLKETHESITALSTWCIHQREYHKAVVATWLKVLKKVKIEHRLVLFYLANDVIQYSKRKSLQFVESWGTAFQKATTLVRDEKVKGKVLRLFKIWKERSIYDEAFLADLCGLLTTTTKKNSSTENNEFQPIVMFEKMKLIEPIEDKTNANLEPLNESPLKLNNCKVLMSTVKELRTMGVDVDNEISLAIDKLRTCISCLKEEISKRIMLVEAVEQGVEYYESQSKEVKVVCNAYRAFGNKTIMMKRKVDEFLATLPSPVPSPDINAPSPSPDNDFEMPEEKQDFYNPSENNSFSQFNNSDTYVPKPYKPEFNTDAQPTGSEYHPTSFTSGFSSFLNSTSLPFDISKLKQEYDSTSVQDNSASVRDDHEGNPIEVIGSSSAVSNRGTVETSIPPPIQQVPTTSILSTPDVSVAEILNLLKQPPPQVIKTEVPSLPPIQSPEICNVPLVPPPMPPPIFQIDEFETPNWLVQSQSHAQNSQEMHHVNQPNVMINVQIPPPRLPLHPDTRHPPPPIYNPDPNTHPLPAKFPTWDSVDTPASPPSFEKESFMDPPHIDYEDESSGIDVDDRSLPVISRLRKDIDHRHNVPDVDHRSQNPNLISLTGSPAIDTDYRNIPVPPKQDSKSNDTIEGANTESVDMDLSEEEEDHSPGKALFKGSFNINTQKRNLMESPLVENDSHPQYKPSMLSVEEEPELNENQKADDSVPSDANLAPVLDIDTSLIELDEKLLSSIDMDTLTNIGKNVAQTPVKDVLVPPPLAASSPYTPRNNFNGTPRHRHSRPPMQHPMMGPRFRPRNHFDGGFRRGFVGTPPPQRFSPFPPRMERGAFRPRW